MVNKKEYEIYGVNLVMAKQTDSTNRLHSNILSLLRFHIVKNYEFFIFSVFLGLQFMVQRHSYTLNLPLLLR